MTNVAGMDTAESEDAQRMGLALEEARRAAAAGEVPVGAVVVLDGRVIGRGHNRVIAASDPTAHAEMQGIRDAARRLGTRDLAGCEMYGTSRACPMCEAGAYWARVSRMYYGEGIADAGAPRLSR